MLWWIAISSAETLHVGPGQEFARIQAAVNAAGYHDTIVLHAGTWDEAVTASARWLTILADGDVTWGARNARALTIHGGAITLRGLTLNAGTAGAVSVDDGDLFIEQTVIAGYNGNTSSALKVARSTLWLVDSWLQDNTYRLSNDPLNGAGLNSDDSELLFLRTTVARNIGHQGGAIYSQLDSVQIIDSTFEENEAQVERGLIFAGGGYGGGGYFDRSDRILVRGSVFRDNFATYAGGALRPWDVRGADGVVIEGCTFTQNEAGNGGAAVAVSSGRDLTFRDSVLEDNVGGARGADIQIFNTDVVAASRNTSCRASTVGGTGGFAYVYGPGTASWTNNLVVGAIATTFGGAWYLERTEDQLLDHNTIIAAGASAGAAVYADSGQVDLRNSLLLHARLGAAVQLGTLGVAPAWDAWFGNPGGDLVGPWAPEYGVFADPLLASYDPADPCAVDDHLQPGSPLIDAGDPATSDLDGSPADIGRWGGQLALPPDADGDGAAESWDCDDANPAVFPGAAERCDGVDEDCDGRVDLPLPADAPTWFGDNDGDGIGRADATVVSCTQPLHASPLGDDCDDRDALTLGPNPELCNGLDDDCDGEVDGPATGTHIAWSADGDGDGHGDAALVVTMACSAPPGLAPATDCDDADPTRHPGAVELCDGQDQDCDAQIDGPEVPGATPRYADADGDGYGYGAAQLWTCGVIPGWSPLDTDCDDAAADTSPAAAERCDGADDDCDGGVDLPLPADASIWHLDADGDGSGDQADAGIASCGPVFGRVLDATDCDDADATTRPGETELCDQRDNDCDGEVDEDAPQAPLWYLDADSDGFGGALTVQACAAPAGATAISGDCDDQSVDRAPGLPERCDGVDQDCDLDVDEDALDAIAWYPDLDEDGFGAATGAAACVAPPGSVTVTGDCDDARDDVRPGAAERCDGVDQDCDLEVDEDANDTIAWYPDLDGDGFGAAPGVAACFAPAGSVTVAGDCDDARDDVRPGAEERCDGVDQDCDLEVDEDAVDAISGWDDRDGDGWGLDPVTACAPAASRDGDCDDDDGDRNPGATDQPGNGVDEDCDGADASAARGGRSGCDTSGQPNPAWALLAVAAVRAQRRRRA